MSHEAPNSESHKDLNKKSFTDIFINKPVLSTVVSLLILVAGLGAIFKLDLREYPKMTNTIITVVTAYPGANASTVQGFVTTPLEKSIASADGIDYLEAESDLGSSTITAHIVLDYEPNSALTQVTGKVSAVLAELPQGTLSPIIQAQTGDTFPNLILGFTSKTLTPEQITAYLSNVISPEIYGVSGVSQILIWGAKNYAMRIWLDTQKMANLGVTPSDVSQALINNNIQAAPGQLKGHYIFTNINLKSDLHEVVDFNNLVVKNDGGRLIRIQDIGKAELGAQDYDYGVTYEGQPAIFAGVSVAPDANPLTVIGQVRGLFPEMDKKLPPGVTRHLVMDSTEFISASIQEVIKTFIEAILIVVLVIFAFLGSPRSVLIPVVTIPLSLVGVCFVMYLLGYSLNLLTLLAMILAIGLVVDDAIVVLENIYRHLEAGESTFNAAIRGAREIKNPVIVMTTTLVAVFAPIGFMGGVTGALFTEFAWTLASAVLISGVIALTFSPMLCSKLISQEVIHKPLVKKVDYFFEKIKLFYGRRLAGALEVPAVVLFIAILVLTSCYFFATGSNSELAPQEDQGFIGISAQAPAPANLDYLSQYNPQLTQIMSSFPEQAANFLVSGVYPNSYSIFAGMKLKPWDQRDKTEMALVPEVQKKISEVTGLQTFAFEFPSLPGIAFGPPFQFIIKSTDSQQAIYPVLQSLVKIAQQSGLFMYVLGDLRFDRPQLDINIDRAKAAALGIQMSEISDALSTMAGGGFVNYFSKDGYSFEVIPQVHRNLRANPQDLSNIQIKTQSGSLVPLSTLVTYSKSIQPTSLNQFDQLNSAMLEGGLMPGVSVSQAYNYLSQVADKLLPQSMSYDSSGALRQFLQEGNALAWAFLFALIIIYLVLSAQFESFRDPLIVLISVPMSLCGALAPIYMGVSTLNIYTEIGLVTLIGLISKHGILMVEFANQLQAHENLSIKDAIHKSATIRLRPILMTTASMIFGVVPLIFATGAGAVSHFDIGLVIAMGMFVGTCFTLFVVPIMYSYLAKDHRVS